MQGTGLRVGCSDVRGGGKLRVVKEPGVQECSSALVNTFASLE